MGIFWILIRNYIIIIFIILFLYNIAYDKASANSKSFRLIGILISLVILSFILKRICQFIYTKYPLLNNYIQGVRPPNSDESTFGMPSGHMLTAGGIGLTLLKNNYTFLNVSIFTLFIGIVYAQRVFIQAAHTHGQALIGLGIGLGIGNTIGYSYLNKI